VTDKGIRLVYRNYARRKIKNNIDLKFLMKLGKSVTESFRLLTDAHGDDVISYRNMSRSRVFE